MRKRSWIRNARKKIKKLRKNESSRDIAVSVRAWLSSGRCHGSILGRGKRFLITPKRPDIFWGLLTFLLNTNRHLFPGVKNTGREFYYWHPSRVIWQKFVELCLHSPTRLHGVHRQNFITNTTMSRYKEKEKNRRRGGRSKPNVTFRITKTPKLFTTTSVWKPFEDFGISPPTNYAICRAET